MAAKASSRDAQRDSVRTITEEAAVIIFAAAPGRTDLGASKSAIELAREYGICVKAVRDIWNLRTWRHATRPHWSHEDFRRLRDKKSTLSARSNEKLEWLIDPVYIAQDFQEIFEEWQTKYAQITSELESEAETDIDSELNSFMTLKAPRTCQSATSVDH